MAWFFPRAAGEFAQGAVAKNNAGHVAELQAETRDRGHGAEGFARPAANAVCEFALAATTQPAGQVAGVDVDRAGRCTQPATGTGSEAKVGEIGLDVGAAFSCGGAA